MNYIEEITAFYKHHNRESEAPIALLSAKMQGIEQGRVARHAIDEANLNLLLFWNITNEGVFFWAMIHNFNHPTDLRYNRDYRDDDGLDLEQYIAKWERGEI